MKGAFIRGNDQLEWYPMKISALILCLLCGLGHAQIPDHLVLAGRPGNVPLHPNVTDAGGLRQGWWTIAIGPRMEQIAMRAEDVAYYRIIEFKHDLPVGVVKDYYPTGILFQEMTLEKMRVGKASFSDYVDYSQPYNVYWPDGSADLISPSRIQCENYVNQGKYELALPFAEQGLAATVSKLGKKHSQYQYFLLRLGRIHQQIGNYAKSEAFYQEGLKAEGDYRPQMMQSLANLYNWTGNYKEAEALSLQALTLTEKEYGKENLNYTNGLNNLGLIYSNLDLKKAEVCFLEAISLERKIFHDKGLLSGTKLNNLGGVYAKQYKLALASQTIEEALKLNEEINGKESMAYGMGLSKLATVKKDQMDLTAAESLAIDAMASLVKSTGTASRFYTEAKITLAETYLIREDYASAEPHFIEAKNAHLERINNFFPKLSEAEKDAFYQRVNPEIRKFNSYCLLRYDANPSIVGELYNNQLMTKAILLNSASKWKQRIRTSGDTKLFGLYTDWENNHGLLARWYKNSANKAEIDSLEAITNAQEKELSARSELFASIADKKKVSWNDIKVKLKPNEVAIEMIRINKYGVTRIVTDSSDASLPAYPQYGLTDTVYYAALMVTHMSTVPELVLFPNGNHLEQKQIRLYSNSIKSEAEDKSSYGHFWKPIADKLSQIYKKKPREGIHVYFSPDGVFNQINVNTLYNPATRRYVLDEMTVNLVTNTRDLLAPQKHEAYNHLAYLFGYPNYGQGGAGIISPSSDISGTRGSYYGAAVADLPATKDEVENIAAIMTRHGWQPEVLTGDEAQEEKIKDSFKPHVMHIATHGFFQPDGEEKENPLLRSGLMLAGANQTIAGKTPAESEDGVLTAYEAMNLNLDNTELVVLSACETGLGDVSNGEGVYGLERAFKVAGARTIIMSLWKVSDEATAQLMSGFYVGWLSGQTKREAFLHAQLATREKFKSPFYWGAFVMVGE
jgi:CHAT domain-containing protein